MEQVRKRYTHIRHDIFIEDENGFNLGYAWTDENDVVRRVIYTQSLDNLNEKTISAKYLYQIYDSQKEIWATVLDDNAQATMDSYVNELGQLQEQPFEDDLTSPIMIDDITNPIYDEVETDLIVGYPQIESGNYNQKLKAGLIPEFVFFFNVQLPLFNGTMDSIQARKFGGTSFI